MKTMPDPEGGQGVQTPPPPPLKNHKAIGFLSNTGPDTLKKKPKATKSAFNVAPIFTKKKNTQKKPCLSWTPSNKTLDLGMNTASFVLCQREGKGIGETDK